ncbi:uncharacterized protein BX663DRAFT_511735 [Cokeromyces recurvatus]|uniref:uncharacterized protein n=1 Tax=Cokeromyces recurvatus TaxID=90255 RepID=UPI00221E3FD3|nr:uncharacterized protein BX663DRAFT_511735 [Cokeromyces recurvatus]KAI7902098.1 hypothetical protein BX663DRAFT_511735 [Cokeromyces recurvatus]
MTVDIMSATLDKTPLNATEAVNIDSTTNSPPAELEKKQKKPIRQAVGGIVVDTTNNKVLMLSSRKTEGVYRLPRGNCDKDETPEQAVVRILHDEAGVQVEKVDQKVGTYTEANKKGKIVGHHWMFEVRNPTLMDCWPALDRKRVWFTIEEAIAHSADRHIARLALNNCSLS